MKMEGKDPSLLDQTTRNTKPSHLFHDTRQSSHSSSNTSKQKQIELFESIRTFNTHTLRSTFNKQSNQNATRSA